MAVAAADSPVPNGDASAVVRRRALTLALLATAIVVYAVPLFIGGDRRALVLWSDCSMTLAAAVVTIKCVRLARSLADHERAAWIWFALGMLSWTLGNAVWSIYEIALHREVPLGSLVDPLQLALPLCFAVGFWRYRTRFQAVGVTFLEIGNLGIILASILLIYAMLYSSIVYETDESHVVVVLNILYPVLNASAFFLALVTVTLYLRGRRRSVMSLLLAGLATLSLTEIVFAYQQLWQDYSSDDVVNAMYLLPLAFVYWSAFEQKELSLRGPMSDLPSEVEMRIHRARQWETLMPALAVASVLAVGFVYFERINARFAPYACGALVVFSVSLGLRDWWSRRVESDLYARALARERALTISEERLKQKSAELAHANQELSAEIRARSQVEEELRQSQKMEALGQLTGGVAHDFNNLLAVILGNLELLDHRLDSDSELRALTSDAVTATERGAALTRHLLAFSRKQQLSPSAVDVARLLEEMEALLVRTLGEAIRIEIEADAGLWPCTADKVQLENALLNLAINARDAMPDGGRLEITAANVSVGSGESSAEPALESGDYVTISVRDSGVGMPAHVRSKAFEPFFTTKEIGAGSGLGLSMVYGFVKQSGGEVAIRSDPGAGTAIDLYLPRAESAARSRTPAAARDLPKGDGERILVVEDEPAVRTLVVTMLDSLGYEVFSAGDGDEALARLDELDALALVLSDVVLGEGMSGSQVLAEARRSHLGIKTLLMSGYAADAHLSDRRERSEILQKPFKKIDLARKIRAALDSGS